VKSPLLLCALLAAPAWPQAPGQSQPEIASHEAPVTFSSRVNLVSVPVVVRDREGRALGNLRQEDFQLFDKGKLQVITKFSLEKSGSVEVEASGAPREPAQASPVAGKPVLPERYVAYLFDDVHLQKGDLLQARQALHRHLDDSLDPTARAAIFTTSGRMLADFTADRQKLHKALDSIQPWTGGVEERCPPMTYYVADLLRNRQLILDKPAEEILAMLDSSPEMLLEVQLAIECLGTPTRYIEWIALINEVKRAGQEALAHGDQETTFALGAVEEVVRRLSAMPGSRTMILVSPGFLLATPGHRSNEYDALDRAIRASVTVNTLDARGVYAIVPGGDASHKQPENYFAQLAAPSADSDVLGELADGTGGTFFHNDNGLKEGLNLLAARPEYLYVLGFSPQNLKFDGSYHNLKVTLKNGKDVTLQVRRGYWAPKHEADPAEDAKEEIREAVFSRDEIQDIPVEIQTEFFKSGEFAAELTVETRLDLKALRFRKAEDRNNDTLTVVTGLLDPNGIYVAGMERVMEMHLRDQTLEAMRNERIAVKESFNVAPGRYVVRVVVRDSEGKTMAARNGGVEIQ